MTWCHQEGDVMVHPHNVIIANGAGVVTHIVEHITHGTALCQAIHREQYAVAYRVKMGENDCTHTHVECIHQMCLSPSLGPLWMHKWCHAQWVFNLNKCICRFSSSIYWKFTWQAWPWASFSIQSHIHYQTALTKTAWDVEFGWKYIYKSEHCMSTPAPSAVWSTITLPPELGFSPTVFMCQSVLASDQLFVQQDAEL